MAFAGHCGVTLNLERSAFDRAADDCPTRSAQRGRAAPAAPRTSRCRRSFRGARRAHPDPRQGTLARDGGAARRRPRRACARRMCSTRATKRASRATTASCTRRSAMICNAPGARPAGACRRCATTWSAAREEFDCITDLDDPGLGLSHLLQHTFGCDRRQTAHRHPARAG